MITGQICCWQSQLDSFKTRRKTASDTEVKVPLTSEYMYTYDQLSFAENHATRYG